MLLYYINNHNIVPWRLSPYKREDNADPRGEGSETLPARLATVLPRLDALAPLTTVTPLMDAGRCG